MENRVRLARVEKGLTREQLADLVGVTRQTIILIEAGKYNPTLKLCLMVKKVTGKTLDELFWIKGELKSVSQEELADRSSQTEPPIATILWHH
jgi:putative transcriptional regulator